MNAESVRELAQTPYNSYMPLWIAAASPKYASQLHLRYGQDRHRYSRSTL